MKAQTDNAEHINRFSILFSWTKNLNKTNNDVGEKQSLSGELQANQEATLFSNVACYYSFIIVKGVQSTNAT